jgi:hypothetical protein
LNAFGGGYYGLSGAQAVPREWLASTPFADYFIPSLVLLVVVGGSLLLAAIAVFARWQTARELAFAAGAIMIGWIAAQLPILGYVSFLQPATAIAGAVVSRPGFRGLTRAQPRSTARANAASSARGRWSCRS